QAYSLVGRARLLGESTKRYEQDSRHFLYQEYLRILADHGPPIFIFENVKGLLSSVVKGSNTFQCIMTDLRSPKNAWRVTSGTVKTGQFDYRLFPLAVRGRVHSPFFAFCVSWLCGSVTDTLLNVLRKSTRNLKRQVTGQWFRVTSDYRRKRKPTAKRIRRDEWRKKS